MDLMTASNPNEELATRSMVMVDEVLSGITASRYKRSSAERAHMSSMSWSAYNYLATSM